MSRSPAAHVLVLGVALTALSAAMSLAAMSLTAIFPARVSAAGLQAFVLAGAPDSFADFETHVHDVGVVYPTYYACAPATGQIVREDAGGQAHNAETSGEEARDEEQDVLARYARAAHVAVMPRFTCQQGATVHTILAEPRVRARVLAGLTAIAQSPAYAGVNLDLENDTAPAADRGAMSAFVKALARRLHSEGRELSVDVDGVTHEDPRAWTGLYDDRAIATAADYMWVIAWGTHWEGSPPGPIAPIGYVTAVARFAATLPDARRKVVLGVPMYGLDWPLPGWTSRPPSLLQPALPSRPVLSTRSSPAGRPSATALRYSNVLALLHTTGASPTLDRSVDEPMFAYTRAGVPHRVWYMNAQSIADRLRIARKYGLGAGVWRLGGEDQGMWSSPAVVEGALG